jgi:hypothetical protein
MRVSGSFLQQKMLGRFFSGNYAERGEWRTLCFSNDWRLSSLSAVVLDCSSLEIAPLSGVVIKEKANDVASLET